MTEKEAEKLRFPIGRPVYPAEVTPQHIADWTADIAALPARLQAAVRDLTPSQLDTPYRPGGWTLRQVVHHIADSHCNGMVRFKLALTEHSPTIKPYEEALWAQLPDYLLPIAPSLAIIEAIHTRWVCLIEDSSAAQLRRAYIHPAEGRAFKLHDQLCLYAWHSNHHLAHITTTIERLKQS